MGILGRIINPFNLRISKGNPEKVENRVREILKEEETVLQREYATLESELIIFRDLLADFARLKAMSEILRTQVITIASIAEMRRMIDRMKTHLKQLRRKNLNVKHLEKSIFLEVAFHEKLTDQIEAEFKPKY